MNPCAKNKRSIAWMAAGVLDVTDAETLRQHMEGCASCKCYWQSMCELSERVVSANNLPNAEPTELFHRTVVQKIRKQAQHACFFDWIIIVQRLCRERPLATFSAGVVVMLALLLWINNSGRDAHRVPSGVRVATVPNSAGRAAPPSRLSSYHRAADISPERLDTLLTQNAARTSPAGETFTVSSLRERSLEN
ncbi:MAG: hypothetical protein JWM16_1768 [Verrucomicrobiales bacterium]|nr:hypothetical protein [Verrucomicrobiales bacterium]